MSKFDTFVYDDEGRYLSYACTFPINTALSGTRSYTYDAKGRLTGETFTPLNLDNQIYDYDDAGNHVTTGQHTFHGETLTAADYDRSNQRTGANFVYTAEGDPTTYKGDTLTFDAEHHLTSYGTALAAKYGPNGTRTWKDVGQDRTTFCYDGETLIGQQTGTEDFVPIVSGPDGLIAFGETYYQFDPEGNVVHRLDADGDLVNTSVYDTWGVATNKLPDGQTATVTDPFGYKGQAGYYTDHETGLILCTHRYYDPALGRWLTRDPIGYDGGINLYGYCSNNPVIYIDRTGQIREIIIVGQMFLATEYIARTGIEVITNYNFQINQAMLAVNGDPVDIALRPGIAESILRKHGYLSKKARIARGKGTFLPRMNAEKLVCLLKIALQNPIPMGKGPSSAGNPWETVRVQYNFGQNKYIGWDSNGNPTTVMEIIINALGEIVTAYPA
ncbi:MAG: tRNA3(Ser)-specific nuclease WapA precursor [bacterium ADurb.Bin429]|nr:MAG: tRNA3(Ser)-specific nuclease WapA precursor [bacterium ADurb.Bin429]